MELNQPLAEYNGKPEIDEGHTKVANELLDAILLQNFSKRQLKIIFYIMRKTYGWNKSEDDISRSQIVAATGLLNPHITKTIQELLEMNVIIIGHGTYAKRYRINKYYDTWRVTETVIVTKTVPVTDLVIVTKTVTERYQNSNNPLLKQYPQKTTPKDNTKDSTFLDFWKAYPKKVGKDLALKTWHKKKPNLDEVLMALEWQTKSQQWKDGFIPNPATYLNEGRWQDEPVVRIRGLQN